MASLPALGSLLTAGNASDNWPKWLQAFQLYLIASGSEWEEKVQCLFFGILLVKRHLRFTTILQFIQEAHEQNLQIVIEKFTEYFQHYLRESFFFFTRIKGSDECCSVKQILLNVCIWRTSWVAYKGWDMCSICSAMLKETFGTVMWPSIKQ